MKTTISILLILLLASCANKVSTEDLVHLNGYWEIEKVEFPDGSTKEYSLNATVDYFQVADMMGYRKKVQPLLDGSYQTSDDAEKFTIYEYNGELLLRYKNDLSEWEEKIRLLTPNQCVFVNQELIAYHYIRFEPINLE